jgi:MFS transporter, putative metabolite:H+ symporter
MATASEASVMPTSPAADRRVWLIIIVAALGYFVDVYDLLLFSAVRSASLTSIGVQASQLLPIGLTILNWQAAGLIVGGIFWGVWGDRRGRMSVLFGSIALYSVANILNAFMGNVAQYEVLRFLAGLGLAGELGAGITIVTETVSKGKRGLATMLVAAVGFLGAIAASVVSINFPWQTAFIIGGIGGLVLLILRAGTFESGLFNKIKANTQVSRGNFLMLFTNGKRFWRYLLSILAGLPVYFVVGILVTAAPELGKREGLNPAPTAAIAIIVAYLALVLGDIVCSSFSQVVRSRKKALVLFNILGVLATLFFVFYPSPNLTFFYLKVAAAGFTVGLWAVLNTSAAEQFGTNLRATVATTVPNFVRGLLIPITAMFGIFTAELGTKYGLLTTGLIVGIIAIIASALQTETFEKELDYIDL